MKKIQALIMGLAALFSASAVPCGISLNVTYGHVLCYGTGGDTASVVVINGRAPYSYTWSNQSADSVSILHPVQMATIIPFSVTVTDANNCTAMVTDTILQDTQIFNTDILTLHLCVDSAFGHLQIDGRGGYGPLTYTVIGIGSNDSGSFTLSPGNYSFVISDSLGCIDGEGSDIFIPKGVGNDSFGYFRNAPTCEGANDGIIEIISFNRGDGPFHYSVDSMPFQSDSIFSDLSSGMHQIDILNYTYGCMYTLDVTVPTSDQICTGISEIDKQTALNIFPNPANTLLNIEYGDVVSESEGYMLELCNGLGQTIYSKKPEAGNTEKINVSTLPNGLYIVLLKRNNAILSASKFVRE